MHATLRRCSGTRASSSGLKLADWHQQGCEKAPVRAGAQAFGWPHSGQVGAERGDNAQGRPVGAGVSLSMRGLQEGLMGRLQRAVGIANSAPAAVAAGQRCITDFWRV
jgi:hypothetical protein